MMTNLATDATVETQQTNEVPDVASKHVFELYCHYKARPFVLVEPLGNYGDQLIWRGAEKLARLAGLQFKSTPYETFMKTEYSDETVIYIHGGGGIHPRWSGSAMKAYLKAVRQHPGVIILGPQTFPTDLAFLQDAVIGLLPDYSPGKAYLIVREQTSLSTLKMLLPGWIELGLDHDTALNLKAADLVSDVKDRQYIFYAIREDREATRVPRRDLLAMWLDPATSCESFDHWVAVHNGARQIIANRLHSAIVGSILGIPSTILPNSYHKNRSVWEHSLQQRGVQWQDKIYLERRAQILNIVYPLRKLMETQAFQKVMRIYVHRAPSV